MRELLPAFSGPRMTRPLWHALCRRLAASVESAGLTYKGSPRQNNLAMVGRLPFVYRGPHGAPGFFAFLRTTFGVFCATLCHLVTINGSSTSHGKVEDLLSDKGDRYRSSHQDDPKARIELDFPSGSFNLVGCSLRAYGHGGLSPRRWSVLDRKMEQLGKRLTYRTQLRLRLIGLRSTSVCPGLARSGVSIFGLNGIALHGTYEPDKR
jgi:hypothetical protein